MTMSSRTKQDIKTVALGLAVDLGFSRRTDGTDARDRLVELADLIERANDDCCGCGWADELSLALLEMAPGGDR